MGCGGPFLTCGPPPPTTATTSSTPPSWTPPPLSLEALAVAGDLSSRDYPNVDQVLCVGKGAVESVELWEGDTAQVLFANDPEAVPAGPPTCPYHPTLLSHSALATDLAVMEVAEY